MIEIETVSQLIQGFFHGFGWGVGLGVAFWSIPYIVSKASHLLDHFTK